MRRIYKAGLLTLLALLLCGSACALELVYPLDGTYVTKSNYLIVKGGTDPLLSGLTIEINGVKSDLIDVSVEAYRNAFGDMLVVEPSFDPGENYIVVEGYLGSERMSVVNATIYYQDRFDVAPPAGFVPEVFHGPEREGPCAACHNMKPSPVDLTSPDPRQNPCGSCHARMLNKAHVHGPAGVYECTYCHEVDSAPNKYQARSGDASLCLECHEDKLDDFLKAKFVHGPIEAQMCMVCHDPHASDFAGQARLPVNELCLGCHAAVANSSHVARGVGGGSNTRSHPLSGVNDPSEPSRELSCTSCHDPHAGNAKAMFTRGIESRMQLCGICHAK